MKFGKYILGLFIFFFAFNIAYTSDKMRGPWSTKNEITGRINLNSIEEQGSYLPLDLAFHTYKEYISPIDGDRCSFYPSCSLYSEQAFKKHNYLIAGFLTFDRLTRCGFDKGNLIIVNNRFLIYDPLLLNDFWFNNKNVN